MVVRRRSALMGLVTVLALAMAVAFFWRFAADRDLVPFLLGCALLVVGVVHGLGWRQSRTPLLVAGMSEIEVRLGGDGIVLPWAEVETVEVADRRALGDGRVVVHPRDSRRALVGLSVRGRVAAMVNQWLYDAALVVPYGVTTRVSVDDLAAELTRLSDGRTPVVALGAAEPEPEATVEVAPAGTLARDDGAPRTQGEPRTGAAPAHPRRLASVVSALRSAGVRRDESTAPPSLQPSTVGALALSNSQVGDPLPELDELRRRAPEEEEAQQPSVTLQPVVASRLTTSDAPSWLDAPEASADADVRRFANPSGASGAGSEIGDEVRGAREWLGLSVDELAERTRIRPYVIESIEAGDFAACGGDFYARGHLRMLAGVLGIEAGPVLSRYDACVATAPVSPRAVFDAELSSGVVRPAGSGSRWGALIATVVVLLLAWGVAKVVFADTGAGTGGSAGAHATRLHSGGVQPGAGPSINDPAIGNHVAPAAPPVHVRVAATGGTSRVVVRDASMKVVYRGVLQLGQSARVSGEGPLRVMAADGGAVSLTAPGHPTALMGAAGQRIFRHVG